MEHVALRENASATRPSLHVLAAVAANLVPLAGVLLLGWDVWMILAVYWLENVIVGLFALPRMAFSPSIISANSTHGIDLQLPPATTRLLRAVALPFFAIHYGGFCAVHGLFVLVILPSSIGNVDLRHAFDLGAVIVSPWALLVAGGTIAVSQAIDLRAWFRSDPAGRLSLSEQMRAPYKRAIVLHVTLLFGGIAISMIGGPLPLLIALTLAKGGYDVWRARRSAATG